MRTSQYWEKQDQWLHTIKCPQSYYLIRLSFPIHMQIYTPEVNFVLFIYNLDIKCYIRIYLRFYRTAETCHCKHQVSTFCHHFGELKGDESRLSLSLQINKLQSMSTSFMCIWADETSKHAREEDVFYTVNLELAIPLPAILSTRRRPKGKPKNDRTTPPISVLQSGHTAFILSHLSTHCTWKKWVQGSSRSSSSSPYLVRQMQHTCRYQ